MKIISSRSSILRFSPGDVIIRINNSLTPHDDSYILPHNGYNYIRIVKIDIPNKSVLYNSTISKGVFSNVIHGFNKDDFDYGWGYNWIKLNDII